MNPYLKIASSLYEKINTDFQALIGWHLSYGIVVSSPYFFALGFHVKSSNLEEAVAFEDSDTLYVTMCCGSMASALTPQVLEHEWVYVDEDGEPLFVKQRFKTQSAKGKDYRQMRCVKQPDGTIAKFPGFKDTRLVPYRFPELLSAKTAGRTIFLTEGEKAADALVSIGVIATSAHAGSGSWPEEITQYFAGAVVIMVPDNDLAGWTYAGKVAAALIPVVKSLRILDLPVEGLTDDAWEWVNVLGGTRQALVELAKLSPLIRHEDDVTTPERLSGSTPNATNATAPGNVHQETDKIP